MNQIKTAALFIGLTAVFLAAGALMGGWTGALIALVLALGVNGYAWWSSDSMALRIHGAQEILPISGAGQSGRLYGLTNDLARQANLPPPRVFLIPTDQPNAFASGRSPETAAVAVTTGLMNTLSQDELAGVVAHELAHIKHRDTLMMTVAGSLAGAVSTLVRFGAVLRGRRHGPFGALGVILAITLAPIAALLIKLAVSRTREYAADRLGAEICGEPAWLASALMKISTQARRTPMHSAENHPETAHLFIVAPLMGRGVDPMFSTHPAIENRIAALNDLARAWGRETWSPGAPSGPPVRRQLTHNRAPHNQNPWGRAS